MARVLVDAHMFSEDWFRPVLTEMVNSSNVSFVFCEEGTFNLEISRVRAALNFYSQVSKLKDQQGRSRRLPVDPALVSGPQHALEQHNDFDRCADCDDAHIFALIYVKPTEFLFSMDARIARCRDRIRPSIDNRYCRFIVISSDGVYRVHRQRILS